MALPGVHFRNDKTVFRGGWGRFIETPLGFSLVAGWAVHASYVGTYNQGFESDGVTPLLSFSNPFNTAAGSSTGTAGFYYAFPIHYKDPSVQQWNMTFEQDLGHAVGMRLSYAGSHGQNLEAMVDLNQVPANPLGYNNTDTAPPATGSCIVDDGSLVSDHRPYPCWSIIQSVVNAAESNYNSGTAEVSKHSSSGLNFDASYTFTRDLSDAGGATPSAFAVAGGSYLTDRFHPGLDYGNVIYDRRHRFLATYLYDLPFGHGQHWLNHGALVNRLAGNWQLGGVTVLQSGPFLTPYQQSVDPANTNILTTVGQARPDQLRNVSPYASSRNTTAVAQSQRFPLPEPGPQLRHAQPVGHRPFRQCARRRRGRPRHCQLLLLADQSHPGQRTRPHAVQPWKQPTPLTIATTSRPTCRWIPAPSAPSPLCKPPRAPARAAWS